MTMDNQGDELDTQAILDRAWKLERVTRPIVAQWDRLADTAREVREADAFRAAWIREARSRRGEWE
jgi:hypothetical protein